MTDSGFEEMLAAANIPVFRGQPRAGSWLDRVARQLETVVGELGLLPVDAEATFLLFVEYARLGREDIMMRKQVSKAEAEQYLDNDVVIRAWAADIVAALVEVGDEEEYLEDDDGAPSGSKDRETREFFEDSVGVPVLLQVWAQAGAALSVGGAVPRALARGCSATPGLQRVRFLGSCLPGSLQSR